MSEPILLGPTIITAGREQTYGWGGGGGYDLGFSKGSMRESGHADLDSMMANTGEEGWPPMEAYTDIGVNYWKWVPAQLDEAIYDIEVSAKNKKNDLEKDIKAEIYAAGVAPPIGNVTPSAEATNNAISVLNEFIKNRSDALQVNQAALDKLPAKRYVGRTGEIIFAEAEATHNMNDYAGEEINTQLDKELAGLIASHNVEIHAAAIKLLQQQLNSWLMIKELQRVLAEAAAKAAVDRAIAEAETKRAADEQTKYEDAIKLTASFYEALGEKFGDKAARLAQDLAENAKGKKIRNASEAFKAFDKYKDVLDKKFSAKDREAMAKLVESMDVDAMGKAAAKFSRGVGYVGPVMDFKDAIIEFGKSQKSGDWKPFFVKVETIGLGLAATALIGAIFGFVAVTPIGILGFAILMAATGAVIDDGLVGEMNDYILAL